MHSALAPVRGKANRKPVAQQTPSEPQPEKRRKTRRVEKSEEKEVALAKRRLLCLTCCSEEGAGLQHGNDGDHCNSGRVAAKKQATGAEARRTPRAKEGNRPNGQQGNEGFGETADPEALEGQATKTREKEKTSTDKTGREVWRASMARRRLDTQWWGRAGHGKVRTCRDKA
ncbi:hypothetical protein ERJ75_001552500 [Trypanosoma vivax]|nr:hypothetical protein ERJ75_001552500 [Trypanosoma vivax]